MRLIASESIINRLSEPMNDPARPALEQSARLHSIRMHSTSRTARQKPPNTMTRLSAHAAITFGLLIQLLDWVAVGEAAHSLAINGDGKIMYGQADGDEGSGYGYLDVGAGSDVRPALNAAVAAALSDAERRLTLRSDIGDFLDLIPADEVRQRVDTHYLRDADVQTALAYINGKEFAALLHDVREVQDFEYWLSRAGVNIKEVLNRLADLLGLSKLGRAGAPLAATAAASARGGGGSPGGQSSSTSKAGAV